MTSTSCCEHSRCLRGKKSGLSHPTNQIYGLVIYQVSYERISTLLVLIKRDGCYGVSMLAATLEFSLSLALS